MEKRREAASALLLGSPVVNEVATREKRGQQEETEVIEVIVARATVESVALLKDDKGTSWRTLFDTGASIDCGVRENLLRLGAEIRRGKPVTLIMADKSERRVDEWANLRPSLGDHEVAASFVVIPEENHDMDLILGLPTQTSLGSITYGKEGLRVAGKKFR